jgi:HPt (histidine-containing phosphotransfer) domain-containing protein
MRRRLGNNDALIVELLDLFLDGYQSQLAAIQSAVAGRNLEGIRRSAHMLKGGASNLSASGVVDAAAALEHAAAQGRTGDLDPHFATLVLEIEQLVAELNGCRSAT